MLQRCQSLATLITKEIGPFSPGTYDVVEIVEDGTIYITNKWYKHGIPQIIHKNLVDTYTPKVMKEIKRLEKITGKKVVLKETDFYTDDFDIENEVIESLEGGADFYVPIIQKIWQKKYPHEELEIQDDGVRSEGGDFTLTLLPAVKLPGSKKQTDLIYAGVLIVSAYSGRFKGIIGPLLVEAIETVVKKVKELFPNAEVKPLLETQQDESFGIWEKIAKSKGWILVDNERQL